MTTRLLQACVLMIAWLGFFASRTTCAQAPEGTGQINAAYPDAHWAVRMGLRSHELLLAVPVVDQVVLVPDAATYLDEIGRWSPAGRWPVLFEDEHLTPMFIRKFKPAMVVRRTPLGEARVPAADWEQGDTAVRQQLIESIVVRAWAGDPSHHTIKDALSRAGIDPVGVVVANVHDPAWTAAVALAVARAQPLVWLDGEYWGPNDELDDGRTQKLLRSIDRGVADLGYTYRGIGSGIDALTVCRSIAGKSRMALAPGESVRVPNAQSDGALAMTDLIGREADNIGQRYAFAGWIFGSEARCAYTAMCSLFLNRDRALLVHGYPAGPPWDAYDMTLAQQILKGRGLSVTVRTGSDVDLKGWQRFIIGGVQADVILMNSKGNPDWFHLFKDELAYPDDVPVLNEPAIVHFIHSWSFTRPNEPASVGGQWLIHGTYAYVGAVQEPFLHAFIPPEQLARRCMSLVPFLVAARVWESEGSRPWRINTYGDPLMVCPPPGTATQARRAPSAVSQGEDLLDTAKRLMRNAGSDITGRTYGEAVRTLVLLGKDELAIQLWRLAERDGRSSFASRWVLGPLFRSRQDRDFLAAWDTAGTHDEIHLDMLWHLLLPRSQTATDDAALLALQSSIRQPMPHIDLERLVPLLRARYDAARVRTIIERVIAHTDHEPFRERLNEMLKNVK